ncbi:MAG: sigma-70 family RNA polymerase sigma factor [Bacteroidota bacterium]
MKSYHTYDDGTLVRLLVTGSDGAFTELYNRYWERMLTIAYVKLQSTSDAKEVVQQVFFDLWKRRKNLSIDCFDKWLAGAVKYKILTYLAKEHRLEQKHAGVEGVIEDRGTEEWLGYHELKATIEATVTGLPDKCRLVYRLSREGGLSLPEIADTLQISQKTAEAHLTKALKTLRTSLKIFSCFI